MPREYFCGWYYKCQSEEDTIALIPAVHTANGVNSYSVQMIDNDGSRKIIVSGDQCQISRKRPYARFGKNIFCENGICLDLHTGGCSAVGSLWFGSPSPIRYDIMGPFSFVPGMECRHSVFSMRHEVNGSLVVNGRIYRFENALGYIEGDRGRSFPGKYLWTQSFIPGGSLMLSVAEIPLGGLSFTGTIGIIRLGGREYRFATYLGAKITSIKNRAVSVRQGDMAFTAELLDRQSHPLRAPVHGAMTRIIRENVSCRARYTFVKNGKTLLDFESSQASFEFEY